MTTVTECSQCGRERTPRDHDYTPMQMIFGQPLGWYSGDDGELCPEDFTKLMRRANGMDK